MRVIPQPPPAHTASSSARSCAAAGKPIRRRQQAPCPRVANGFRERESERERVQGIQVGLVAEHLGDRRQGAEYPKGHDRGEAVDSG